MRLSKSIAHRLALELCDRFDEIYRPVSPIPTVLPELPEVPVARGPRNVYPYKYLKKLYKVRNKGD